MGEKQKRVAEDLADSEPPAKKRKKKRTSFNLDAFTKSLRQDDCFSVLQKFVHTCEDSKEEDPAVLFLQGGGTLNDILNILERNYDAHVTDITTVFAAVRLLILRTLKHVPEQKASAEGACQHLLGHHLSSLHKLLNTDSSFCQKVVLELLTAVVMLSSKLAVEVLKHVNFEAAVLEKITRPADAAMKWSPRQCFIHFLMAFLVEGSVGPIRMLLEKKKLLTCIIPGLRYDKSDLVILTLVTIKTKIVECAQISKTQKMHTFSTPVMKALLSLYQWVGPSKAVVQKSKKNWKKGAKKKDVEVVETEVDEVQREAVAEAVHSLLLVLCSSYKFGIVFRDPAYGTGATSPNTLAASVLKGLSEPWKHKFQVELIVNIVKCCSELAQHVFQSVGSFIEPRAKHSWLSIMDYITQVVSVINVKPLFNMDPSSFQQACRFVLVPKHLLITIGKPGVQHGEPAVCLAAVRFLNKVLQNVAEVYSARKSWTKDADNLMLHVASCCPIDLLIRDAWNTALTNKSASAVLPVPTREEQLFALAELIALYQQFFPKLIESPNALGAALTQALLLDGSERGFVHMQVKVVHILAKLENYRLSEDKAKFPQVITLLLEATDSADPSIVLEAQSALGSLLVDSDLLELPATGTGGELSVWLYCWYSVAADQKPLVLAFLRDVIMRAVRERPKYIKKVLEAQEALAHEVSSVQEEQSVTTADKIFTDLLRVNTDRDEKSEKAEGSEESEDVASTWSVLFVAAVDIASEKELDAAVEKFLSRVLVHLLHLQVHPEQYLQVVNQWKMPRAIACYLQGWGSTEGPSALKKQFGKLESSLSNLLLLPGGAAPELKDCSDPIAVILLTRLVIFHVVQLAKQEKLTAEVCEAGVTVLASLLSAAQELENISENSKLETIVICLKTIFRHPVLLSYFSPLCKKKQIMKKLVTDFLLDILGTTFESFSEICKENRITVPLKQKLQKDIIHHLQNPEKTPSRKKTLVLCVQNLALSYVEMQDVVTKIVPYTFISPWTELLACLLKASGLLPTSVVKSLGDVLLSGLPNHINDEHFCESGVIRNFCQYLETFPFCTEYITDELFEVAVQCNCSDLAVTLLRHTPSLVPKLASLVLNPESSLLHSPELLFPFLDASKSQLPSELLSKVYDRYRKQIRKAAKLPFSGPDYLRLHMDLTVRLITGFMDPQECKTYSQLLTEDRTDLEISSEPHLSVVHALRLGRGWEGCGALLARLLVQQLASLLQAPETPSAQLVSLCSLLKDHLADRKIEWGEETLQLNANMKALPPLLLQFAFKNTEKEVSVVVLNAFAHLINKLRDPKFAEIVFEMAISHSQFLSIVLSKEDQGLKLAVLVLLYTCCKVSPNVMKTTHVPVWLGAYGATLSHCDQMLLKLLHLYESSGLSLYAYRPFLWGEAAVSHYSVRSSAGMSLWRIPEGSQALELLVRETVENTIVRFPYRRCLPQQEEEESKNVTEGKAAVELVSLDKNRPDVYDPAFFLPLFSHVLAPEMVVKTFKFFRTGAMALTLSTLGSQNRQMRAAALSVLARYLSHLESYRPTQLTMLITQFVQMVRSKLNSLMKQKGEEEKEVKLKEVPRVPFMTATFLAKAVLILLEPAHPLYAVLNFLLLQKPIDTIPGFMLFLRANQANYRTYQYWMLECIRDGMKSMHDVLAVSRNFGVLQSFFSSSLSNAYIQSLVLQILEVTVCVRGSKSMLMRRDLLPWLYSARSQVLEQGNSAVAMGYVRLLVVLQDRIPELLPLSVPLLKLLPRNLCRQNLCWVLKFASNCVDSLTSEHLLLLLQWCYPILGSAAVSKYAEQLGFLRNIGQEVLSDDSELPGVLDENVSPKKVVADDVTLLEDLKTVVLTWLRR